MRTMCKRALLPTFDGFLFGFYGLLLLISIHNGTPTVLIMLAHAIPRRLNKFGPRVLFCNREATFERLNQCTISSIGAQQANKCQMHSFESLAWIMPTTPFPRL